MTKTAQSDVPATFEPAADELPRLSDAERRELRATLDRARGDIAAGNYDVLTSDTLRAEFDGIFYDDKSDEELDVLLAESNITRS